MDIDCSFKKLDEGRKEEKVYERGEARMDSSQGGIEMEKRSTTEIYVVPAREMDIDCSFEKWTR